MANVSYGIDASQATAGAATFKTAAESVKKSATEAAASITSLNTAFSGIDSKVATSINAVNTALQKQVDILKALNAVQGNTGGSKAAAQTEAAAVTAASKEKIAATKEAAKAVEAAAKAEATAAAAAAKSAIEATKAQAKATEVIAKEQAKANEKQAKEDVKNAEKAAREKLKILKEAAANQRQVGTQLQNDLEAAEKKNLALQAQLDVDKVNRQKLAAKELEKSINAQARAQQKVITGLGSAKRAIGGQTAAEQKLLEVRRQLEAATASGAITQQQATALQAAATEKFKAGVETSDKLKFSMTELAKSITLALGPLSGVASRVTAFSSLTNQATLKIAALIGAFVGFGALLLATKKSADRLDALIKKADQLGVSFRFLQELEFVGIRTGVDDTAGALTTLVQRIGELASGSGQAKRSLDLLKLPFSDLRGLNPEALIFRILEAFEKLDDQNIKNAASAGLVGRSHQDMVRILQLGVGGFTELTERAQSLGIVLEEAAARQAETLNDRLGELGKIATATGDQILVNLQPFIIRIADFMIRAALETTNLINRLADLDKRSVGSLLHQISGLEESLARLRAIPEGDDGGFLGDITRGLTIGGSLLPLSLDDAITLRTDQLQELKEQLSKLRQEAELSRNQVSLEFADPEHREDLEELIQDVKNLKAELAGIDAGGLQGLQDVLDRRRAQELTAKINTPDAIILGADLGITEDQIIALQEQAKAINENISNEELRVKLIDEQLNPAVLELIKAEREHKEELDAKTKRLKALRDANKELFKTEQDGAKLIDEQIAQGDEQNRLIFQRILAINQSEEALEDFNTEQRVLLALQKAADASGIKIGGVGVISAEQNEAIREQIELSVILERMLNAITEARKKHTEAINAENDQLRAADLFIREQVTGLRLSGIVLEEKIRALRAGTEALKDFNDEQRVQNALEAARAKLPDRLGADLTDAQIAAIRQAAEAHNLLLRAVDDAAAGLDRETAAIKRNAAAAQNAIGEIRALAAENAALGSDIAAFERGGDAAVAINQADREAATIVGALTDELVAERAAILGVANARSDLIQGISDEIRFRDIQISATGDQADTKAEVEAREAAAKTFEKQGEAIEFQREQIKELNKSLEDGLGAYEQQVIVQGALAESQEQINAALYKGVKLSNEAIEAHRDRAVAAAFEEEALQDLVSAETKKAAAQEKARAQLGQEFGQVFEKSAKALEDAFSDAFDTIFETGKLSFTDLANEINKIFKTELVDILKVLVKNPGALFAAAGGGGGDSGGAPGTPGASGFASSLFGGGGGGVGGFFKQSLGDLFGSKKVGDTGGSIGPAESNQITEGGLLNSITLGNVGTAVLSIASTTIAAFSEFKDTVSRIAPREGLHAADFDFKGLATAKLIGEIGGGVIGAVAGIFTGGVGSGALGAIGAQAGVFLAEQTFNLVTNRKAGLVSDVDLGLFLATTLIDPIGGLLFGFSSGLFKKLKADAQAVTVPRGEGFNNFLIDGRDFLPGPFGDVGSSLNSDFLTREFRQAFAALIVESDIKTAEKLSPEEIETVALGFENKFGIKVDFTSFDNEVAQVLLDRFEDIVIELGGDPAAVFGDLFNLHEAALESQQPEIQERFDAFLDARIALKLLLDEFDNFGRTTTEAAEDIKRVNKLFDDIIKVGPSLGIDISKADFFRRKALQSLTDDFDANIQRAILGFEDPLALQLVIQKEIGDQLLREAEVLGADLTEVMRLNALERGSIIETFFSQAANNLQAFLTGLTDSQSSPLAPTVIYDNALKTFNEQVALALTGDPVALSNFQTSATNLLDASRAVFASSTDFFVDFFRVLDIGNQLVSQVGPEGQENFQAEEAAESQRRADQFLIDEAERERIDGIRIAAEEELQRTGGLGVSGSPRIQGGFVTDALQKLFVEQGFAGLGQASRDPQILGPFQTQADNIAKAEMDAQRDADRLAGQQLNRDDFLRRAAIRQAELDQTYLESRGFAHGGSFTVGGAGGTDSQHVSFMATPGESVTVRTPAQQQVSGSREALEMGKIAQRTQVDSSRTNAELLNEFRSLNRKIDTFGSLFKGVRQSPPRARKVV